MISYDSFLEQAAIHIDRKIISLDYFDTGVRF
jgi:hypothetical protein